MAPGPGTRFIKQRGAKKETGVEEELVSGVRHFLAVRVRGAARREWG